ncbi:putative 7 alpha-cephem-methoxylase [Mollisia scopiformis]|uniref:Putative 7 alpha-cephem-methoxylase n=1 Tax=Mollisia scopiformis TaxID=149040 RepID=A0A194XIE4_MOLSC|nr:putative 7 alpha-cephem-methoxylase [Mollisia scopiformis]KUJ19901.1 putative 7 alpha-cephem-methoxylase [Mollisia scopiformis]
MASDHVLAEIQFLKWTDLYLSEKPFQLFLDYDIPVDLQDQRTTNLNFEDKRVFVENMRGREKLFELDKHGFLVRDFAVPVPLQGQIIDEDTVMSTYVPAAEKLLRTEVIGVDRLFLLDRRVSARSAAERMDDITSIDLLDRSQRLKPASSAHVDHTAVASINHVLREFPDEGEHLLRGRVRIINVWLPLSHTVKDWPLALCDGSTISLEHDLVDTDIVRRSYQGGTMYMLHRAVHKWYFLEDQKTTEAFIFKQFDLMEVEARVCPHVSFKQSDASEDILPRESLEMRFIVFTNPS